MDTWMPFPAFEKHWATWSLKGFGHHLYFAVADSGNQVTDAGDYESLLASACVSGNKSSETSSDARLTETPLLAEARGAKSPLALSFAACVWLSPLQTAGCCEGSSHIATCFCPLQVPLLGLG